MSDKENKMGEFEMFFHSEKKQFKKLFSNEFADKFDTFLDFKKFFYDVLLVFDKAMEPPLTQLMLKQNPEFKTFTHPSPLKFMKEINETCAYWLMWEMHKLCNDYKQNVDMKQKYPRLEEFRAFYCHPEKPHTLEDKSRKYHPELNDEQWKTYQQQENDEMLKYNNWKQKRWKEYYDVMQPALFNYLPELQNMEGDCWVMFAVNIRDNYELWESANERLEILIDFEMPPETIDLSDDDFRKEISKRFEKYDKQSTENRNRKINSGV